MSKISELSDGGSLQSTDYLIAVRSGGNVKVRANGAVSGTTGQFSTSLNVDGTVTAHGLKIENSTAVILTLEETGVGTFYEVVDGGNYSLRPGSLTTTALRVASNNDISFYEDTGTTPKFFWDASAESLGIGTTSPSSPLHISDSGNSVQLRMQRDASNYWGLQLTGGNLNFQDIGSSTTPVSITSAGNVGIGTSSPTNNLDIAAASSATLSVRNTSTVSSILLSNGSSANQIFSRGANSSTGRDLAFVQGTAEAMRIDSSGNLLVGTTDNNVGNNSGGTDVGISLREYGEIQGSATSACLVLNRQSTDGDIAVLKKDGTTVGSIGARNGTPYFANNVGEGIRIIDGYVSPCDSSGNGLNNAVDVGSATYKFKDLYLSGTANAGGLTVAASGANGIELDPDAAATTDSGRLFFSTSAGTNAIFGSSGNLRFTTGATAGASSGTERMRLDASGNLLVGCTSTTADEGGIVARPDSDVSNIYIGHATGTAGGNPYIRFRYGSGNIGSITQSGTTAVLYNTSSDQRLKDNIVDAPSASDDIDAIQVRSFDWKADGSHQRYGMVAQELMTVAPEAVSGDPESDDMMGVDYSKLVPMLVKEIQSLRARVAQLEGA